MEMRGFRLIMPLRMWLDGWRRVGTLGGTCGSLLGGSRRATLRKQSSMQQQTPGSPFCGVDADIDVGADGGGSIIAVQVWCEYIAATSQLSTRINVRSTIRPNLYHDLYKYYIPRTYDGDLVCLGLIS